MNKRFQPNEMIGEYRVTNFLGAGGMGEVYQGVHAKLGRPAAIKVLSESCSDASFTERFFNEARLQASLHHPNVAALYDFQEIGNRLCIFMELVNGESLEDLVARRAFTVEDAMKTFQPIVEAIAFIHQNGILHRDIKSQNIKLTSGGTVKLLDFGIAKDSTSHSLTQTGGVIGTPSYLAPEQLAGVVASAQTDVWALGVLLYEMLTGVEPFKADTIGALCMQITLAEFEAPEKINPAVPREVSRIVARCLKKNVAERYRTADELLEDVREFLNDEKSQAKTVTAFSGLKKSFAFSSRNAPASSTAPNASSNKNQTDTTFNKNTSDNYSLNTDSNGSESYLNQTSRKKLPVAMIAVASSVAVILLFSLIGIGVWLMGGSSAGDSTASPALKTVVDSKDGKTALVQPAKAATQRRVRVDVDEGSAQVFRNNQSIGATPFDLEAADGEKIDLTLKRNGFEDKAVQIEVSSRKQVYTFSLKSK
jgi:serine/threonine-protein kinase